MLEQMVTCYKTYRTANPSPVDAVNMLIVGFEGRLRQWLSLLQKKTPTLLTDWASSVVLNEQGQPQLLSDGSTENNFIGKLISAIEAEFIGQRGDASMVQTLALNQMKLKSMTNFHAHYEEYLRRLFQLPNALDQQWKNHFVSTQPKWFAEHLVPILKDPRHRDSWGSIHQGVVGLIMQLCAEQKQIKHVKSAKSKYLISPLCKQYHVESGIPTKFSRGKRSKHHQKVSSARIISSLKWSKGHMGTRIDRLKQSGSFTERPCNRQIKSFIPLFEVGV